MSFDVSIPKSSMDLNANAICMANMNSQVECAHHRQLEFCFLDFDPIPAPHRSAQVVSSSLTICILNFWFFNTLIPIKVANGHAQCLRIIHISLASTFHQGPSPNGPFHRIAIVVVVAMVVMVVSVAQVTARHKSLSGSELLWQHIHTRNDVVSLSLIYRHLRHSVCCSRVGTIAQSKTEENKIEKHFCRRMIAIKIVTRQLADDVQRELCFGRKTKIGQCIVCSIL